MSVHVCVHTHACACVRARACVYAYMYECMRVCVCARACAHTAPLEAGLQFKIFLSQPSKCCLTGVCLHAQLLDLQIIFFGGSIFFFVLQYLHCWFQRGKENPEAWRTFVSKQSWKSAVHLQLEAGLFQSDLNLVLTFRMGAMNRKQLIYIPRAYEWFHYGACLYPLHSHSDKEDICFRV